MSKNSDSPIIFYHYFDLTDPEYFCSALEKRFRDSGRTRPIEFRKWNCYKAEPGRDGDLFSYDAVCLSALADKGYIRRLPEIIPTDDVFDWVRETSRYKGQLYGIPIIGCCNAVISRVKDRASARNIYELEGKLAAPLRSMVAYYYVQSFCNYQADRGKCLDAMKRLKQLLGGADLESTRFSNYDGVRRFMDGECRYFLGFTENLRFFDRNEEYAVELANFSDNEENQVPLFMVDLVSMGKDVAEEKLLDCLDLMEIIADADFLYDVCVPNGDLQYMLPVHSSLYPRLAALDPIYGRLREIASDNVNSVMRYNKNFFEDIGPMGEKLSGLIG